MYVESEVRCDFDNRNNYISPIGWRRHATLSKLSRPAAPVPRGWCLIRPSTWFSLMATMEIEHQRDEIRTLKCWYKRLHRSFLKNGDPTSNRGGNHFLACNPIQDRGASASVLSVRSSTQCISHARARFASLREHAAGQIQLCQQLFHSS